MCFATIKDKHDYIIEHTPLEMIEVSTLAYWHEWHIADIGYNRFL